MVLWERRHGPDDEGVSPVVGMVLVLGISIVGIAAILYWGLPAIDEMKANVEHKSVEAQFQELDATIKELVAGTTEKTAKKWQPTLNRGQVYLVNETEGWVYATEMWRSARDYDFLYSGFEDGDAVFEIKNNEAQAVAAANLRAYRVNGTTSGHDLLVDWGTTPTGPWTRWGSAQWSWAASTTYYIRLREVRDAVEYDVPIKNATIRLRVYDGPGEAVAQAWYVPTGRVDYRLETSLGTKTVTENNGAVLSGNGVTSAFINPPPIPPVSTASGVPRSFARAVLLNATGSFGGEDRFNVLVTLYSTSTLASYDCTKTDSSDCTETAKLFLFGSNREAWKNYLTNAGRGYTYTSEPPIDSANEVYLKYRAPGAGAAAKMGYTLLQSTVQLTSQG